MTDLAALRASLLPALGALVRAELYTPDTSDQEHRVRHLLCAREHVDEVLRQLDLAQSCRDGSCSVNLLLLR